MKKIIAFSGTHGSGKTTLAYELTTKMKKAGHNVVLLNELARKCPFEINQNSDPRTEAWIICKQIVEELELIDTIDYLIVDRSVLDSYIYNLVLSTEPTMCSHMISYLIAHVKAYYKTIYVPNKDAFNYHEEDGVRDLDTKFRDDVYYNMLRVYKHFNSSIPYKIIQKPEEVYADIGV